MASESLSAGTDLAERLAAARREVEANILRLDLARSRLQATQQRISAGRTEREALHDSAFARLAARLESQPVIEQAKGILIAQVGCTPDEAFSTLRAASQRANVRVRDLAQDIVDRAASGGHANGQPRRLIVDLAEVGFANQAAVRALAATREELAPECALLLRSPSRAARRVLAPAGLLDDGRLANGQAPGAPGHAQASRATGRRGSRP